MTMIRMQAPRPPCRSLAFIIGISYAILIARISDAFHPQSGFPKTTKPNLVSSESSSNNNFDENIDKLYFDIAIATPADNISLGRLTFRLTPRNNPNHLPLHISNLISLASGQRKSVDPKATYEGCTFQYSPSTIEDGSFRYRWGHVCVGRGRNGIRTTSASGAETSWDEPFSDPGRIGECAHKRFGGVYYGQEYDEISEMQTNDDGRENAVVLLTVPINGPGAGTSKFSIVRVSESPKEWGERLLLNSAVVGYLDCGADGTFGDNHADENDGTDCGPTALQVLRTMARQRMGPPMIVNCGMAPS